MMTIHNKFLSLYKRPSGNTKAYNEELLLKLGREFRCTRLVNKVNHQYSFLGTKLRSEIVSLNGRKLCPVCQQNVLPHLKHRRRRELPEFCSKRCYAGSDIRQERNPSPFKSECVQKKLASIFLAKYGVNRPLKSAEVKSKIKRTLLRKYGSPKFIGTESFRDEMTARYGVDNPNKHKGLASKRTKNLVRARQLNPNSGYMYKHVSIQGREFVLQGYEPQVLNWMLEERKVTVNMVTTHGDGLPIFRYKYGGDRYYLPDFFIANKVIVEAKSAWYLLGTPKRFEENRRKIKAASKEYQTYMIVSNGKVCYQLPQDWVDMTRQQVKSMLPFSN